MEQLDEVISPLNKSNIKEVVDSVADSNKKKPTKLQEHFVINHRFYLLKIIGAGSFGEIHLAFDSQMKKLKAIKFVYN